MVIFGKKVISKRKVAWYGDSGLEYTYSKTTKTALTWTKELLEIKVMVEKESGESFNSCLLNLYHSGDEGMGCLVGDLVLAQKLLDPAFGGAAALPQFQDY